MKRLHARFVIYIARQVKELVWKLRPLMVVAAVLAVMTLGKSLTAGYPKKTLTAYVEIEGADYGSFGHLSDLNDLMRGAEKRSDYTKISLKRNFVADPSLYQWARSTTKKREGLKDIHLVLKNRDGFEVSRYVLKLCQPLSWTLEAADTSSGGFREKVDIAVREIAIY